MMVGMVFLFISGGQALAKGGSYIAMDLGIAVGSGLDTSGTANDFRTICDQFIDPTATCSDPANDKWTDEFDGGTGILTGLALGYRWRNFRIEGEYFYRGATHDSVGDVNFSGVNLKSLQEIAEADEEIGHVLSHSFFTNLYYDFTSDSKWTPYLGFGLGFALVSLDYSNRVTRSGDPEDIGTFGPADSTNEVLRNKLAGTTSIARSDLSDTLFGYQAIAGVDYRISEPVTIGLKFRWADFGEFKDGDEFLQLRSHDATNSPVPGSPRVGYEITTDDIRFWGLSLNMKYHF